VLNLLIVGERGDINWLGASGGEAQRLRLFASQKSLRVTCVHVQGQSGGQFLSQQQSEIRETVEQLAPLVTDVHAQNVVALLHLHQVLKFITNLVIYKASCANFNICIQF